MKQRKPEMTKAQYLDECGSRLIDPWIALDDDRVRDALESNDDAEVIRLLDEEF